jgi:hypothetical protein
MMAVHEAGHVLGAWATGGTVRYVELRPWRISRTDVMPNPSPLVVAWAGPMVGVIVPSVLWGIVRVVSLPLAHPPRTGDGNWKLARLLRFFAGFCLIANGAYLAFGSFDKVGDAGDLLRHSAAAWQLWLFGAVCVPAGLWLWHGLGGANC